MNTDVKVLSVKEKPKNNPENALRGEITIYLF